MKTFGVATRPIYCTKIASKLARTYTDRHGLKDLVRELLAVDLSKQQQSSDWGAEASVGRPARLCGLGRPAPSCPAPAASTRCWSAKDVSPWRKPVSTSCRCAPSSTSRAGSTRISFPTRPDSLNFADLSWVECAVQTRGRMQLRAGMASMTDGFAQSDDATALGLGAIGRRFDIRPATRHTFRVRVARRAIALGVPVFLVVGHRPGLRAPLPSADRIQSRQGADRRHADRRRHTAPLGLSARMARHTPSTPASAPRISRRHA